MKSAIRLILTTAATLALILGVNIAGSESSNMAYNFAGLGLVCASGWAILKIRRGLA